MVRGRHPCAPGSLHRTAAVSLAVGESRRIDPFHHGRRTSDDLAGVRMPERRSSYIGPPPKAWIELRAWRRSVQRARSCGGTHVAPWRRRKPADASAARPPAPPHREYRGKRRYRHARQSRPCDGPRATLTSQFSKLPSVLMERSHDFPMLGLSPRSPSALPRSETPRQSMSTARARIVDEKIFFRCDSSGA